MEEEERTEKRYCGVWRERVRGRKKAERRTLPEKSHLFQIHG
jgi:hypothetical protein